uniref:T cell receptor alpha variable 26-2 n=2 Tax=Mustela putorius furo TaxID=9669 RepID=M3Y7J3_MUSPF
MRSLTKITILLTLGIMSDADPTQPNAMEGTEGEPVHLPCNHSTISGNQYIYWYRQIPNQSPEYMIHGLKDNVTEGITSLIITRARKSSTLILPRVTLGDAAVYYCLLREAH